MRAITETKRGLCIRNLTLDKVHLPFTYGCTDLIFYRILLSSFHKMIKDIICELLWTEVQKTEYANDKAAAAD